MFTLIPNHDEQQLPREIYHSILEFLPLNCLFRRCNLVCHEFYNIIHCNATFQKSLYLNNCSRDFELIANYYFDQDLKSCVMVVERFSFPNSGPIMICVMKELRKVKDPYQWRNALKFRLERPLVLMRVYYNENVFAIRNYLVLALFDESQQKDNGAGGGGAVSFFREMCLLYEKIQQCAAAATHNCENIFNLRDGRGSTMLMNFAFGNSYEKFRWMCENLTPPNQQQSNNDILLGKNRTYGQNCLHIACSRNSMKIVEYLVEERGVSVNAMDLDGYTCLHLAASKSNLILCKYLIEHGADKFGITMNGFRPVHLVNSQDEELKKLLAVETIRN